MYSRAVLLGLENHLFRAMMLTSELDNRLAISPSSLVWGVESARECQESSVRTSSYESKVDTLIVKR